MQGCFLAHAYSDTRISLRVVRRFQRALALYNVLPEPPTVDLRIEARRQQERPTQFPEATLQHHNILYTYNSPVEAVRLPRRRREPMLQHHRDLRPNLVRDVRPARAWTEREGLARLGLERCSEQGHGLDVCVEHKLQASVSVIDMV